MVGFKRDSNKTRWDLLPYDAIECIAKVLTWACSKEQRGERAYPERNWEKGIAYSRVFAAMMRHACAWWSSKLDNGCPYDEESGMLHSWHFLTCALFLVTYEARDMFSYFDDRPKPNQSS